MDRELLAKLLIEAGETEAAAMVLGAAPAPEPLPTVTAHYRGPCRVRTGPTGEDWIDLEDHEWALEGRPGEPLGAVEARLKEIVRAPA